MATGQYSGATRFVIRFVAMGCQGKIAGLRVVLEETPDDTASDRKLINGWTPVVGLAGSFHFKPYIAD